MYEVASQAVADYIMSDSRTFRAVMKFEDGTELSNDIVQITLNNQSSDNDIVAGAVISQGLTAEVAQLSADITGKTFTLYWYAIDISGYTTHKDLTQYTHKELSQYTHKQIAELGSVKRELIPAGRYKVISCKQSGEVWTIEAKDGLYFADASYEPAISFPTTAIAIENDICNKLGILHQKLKSTPLADKDGNLIYTVDGKGIYVLNNQPALISAPVEDCTMRDMLGYCACLDEGSFAVLDRDGRLSHKKYTDSGYVITSGRADEPETEQNDITITQVICDVDEQTTLTSDTDPTRAMRFTNPYMTQKLFDEITKNYVGFSYRPCTINHILADPRLDVWDIVTIRKFDDTEYKVPCMGITYSFDGGLSASITASGSTDVKATAGNNDGPITRNVKKIVTAAQNATEEKLKEAFEESINYITGNEGGYVVTKLNADGKPIATYYTDNIDIDKANDILQINNRGIAGTTNGVNGPYNLAIDIKGRINATQILTGILSAIVIQSQNYSETKKTGSKISLEDGNFSLAGGAMTYKNGAFSINGGNINIKTSKEDYSAIKLSYGDWEIEISPLQWILKNKSIDRQILAQAGALYFQDLKGNNKTYIEHENANFGNDMTVRRNFKVNGTATIDGNVAAQADVDVQGVISSGKSINANKDITAFKGNVWAKEVLLDNKSGGYFSLQNFISRVENYMNQHP